MNIRVTRLANGPIIGPHLHPSIGVNIQGPSLIRVPDWIDNRLGAYYLYFADHKGSYIRLAYAGGRVSVGKETKRREVIRTCFPAGVSQTTSRSSVPDFMLRRRS